MKPFLATYKWVDYGLSVAVAPSHKPPDPTPQPQAPLPGSSNYPAEDKPRVPDACPFCGMKPHAKECGMWSPYQEKYT